MKAFQNYTQTHNEQRDLFSGEGVTQLQLLSQRLPQKQSINSDSAGFKHEAEAESLI